MVAQCRDGRGGAPECALAVPPSLSTAVGATCQPCGEFTKGGNLFVECYWLDLILLAKLECSFVGKPMCPLGFVSLVDTHVACLHLMT